MHPKIPMSVPLPTEYNMSTEKQLKRQHFFFHLSMRRQAENWQGKYVKQLKIAIIYSTVQFIHFADSSHVLQHLQWKSKRKIKLN